MSTATAPDAGVLEERRDGIVILTLNAPTKRNALIPAVRDGLVAALERLERDAECRVIVIAGAGEHFCAGGDISQVGPLTPLDVRQLIKAPQRLVRLIVNHGKPIIAAVEGPAFGAGMALAAACDVVVAAESATFCAAYGRIGLMPDVGVLWSLPLRVGMGAVREIVMFCEVISAPTALAMGLVDRVVEPGRALTIALERAGKLATAATAAIGLTKAILARAPQGLEAVLAAEVECVAVLSTTHDQQEGILAFREKRKPTFIGR